ncbi:MAG TPA: dockerin type I domain-containing protein [Tepidisphaeraceae bacterium]|jgi:hypothetical protein|nr:dockerin type I domain-containing protein [Tepidisphaeraceae bacterium]
MKAHRSLILAAAVATLAVGAQHSFAQVLSLQHTDSIDLSSLFSSTSGYGNSSLSIAFDGTNAYIGGYNNTAAAANVGVVQVQNVLTANPSLNGLAPSQFSAPSDRGLDALGYLGGALYEDHDSGTAATSFIQKINLDGTIAWTTLSPNGQRPQALAIDPTGNNGSPAIAFLSQGNGRRLALDTSGNVLYTIGGGTNPGGIINASANSPFSSNTASNSQTNWRALAFDSAGNIAVGEDSGFGYGVRTGVNSFSALDGTPNIITRSELKTPEVNNVGIGVALLQGASPSDLLVFAPRVVGTGSAGTATLKDTTGAITTASSGMIQIRNVDGTTTNLPQTALGGGDDGIGKAFSTELRNFAVAQDASGLPILLAVSPLENRLDIYQMEPTYTADSDGTWSDTSKWLVGVVPNSATLNAHFAPTTASRTITVSPGMTTKDLKLDSPNGYTFIGSSLTISAPAGQNGNVQVLQGTHFIQNPLSLAMNTVFSVASGAGLTVTGGVTGAGLTMAGPASMDLAGTSTLTGPIGVSGGTLNVVGSTTATQITTTASPSSPGTLNITGTLAVTPNGSSSSVSTLSPDTTLAFSGTGKLDLNDNDAILNYYSSPIDSIRSQLSTGQIISSSAIANGHTAIAYAENSLLGLTTFDGQPVTATSLLLKYTYYGDLNLDGKINADDYAIIDRAFAQGGLAGSAHWTDGDVNYDGVVTSADYLLIDSAFAHQTGTLSPTFLAQRDAQFGDAYVQSLLTSIPEPSLFAACSLALPLLRRRRPASQA